MLAIVAGWKWVDDDFSSVSRAESPFLGAPLEHNFSILASDWTSAQLRRKFDRQVRKNAQTTNLSSLGFNY